MSPRWRSWTPNTGGVVWRGPGVLELRSPPSGHRATQPDGHLLSRVSADQPHHHRELLLLDGNGGVTILKPSLPQVTYLSLIG